MDTTRRSEASLPCFSPAIRHLIRGAVFGAAAMLAAPSHGAFHLWQIRELYTDSSGSLQFIEFFTSQNSQQFVGGQQITITPTAGPAHTFTIPSNLPGDTANHAFLIGTSGAHAAGAPTPDYIMPNGFVFPAGGTINFFGANSGPYTALPTDGFQSRNFGDGNSVNSPQNFAGQVGLIVPVPEPATWGLMALGMAGFWFLLRPRRVQPSKVFSKNESTAKD